MNNNIFNLYSISISMQLLGHWTTYVPRMLWNLIGSVIIFIIAISGRNNVYTIIGNTVALIAYWTAIFFVIILVEHVVIRRKYGYDVTAWDDAARLPKGHAAMLAFCIGAAGSILGVSNSVTMFRPCSSQLTIEFLDGAGLVFRVSNSHCVF